MRGLVLGVVGRFKLAVSFVRLRGNDEVALKFATDVMLLAPQSKCESGQKNAFFRQGVVLKKFMPSRTIV